MFAQHAAQEFRRVLVLRQDIDLHRIIAQVLHGQVGKIAIRGRIRRHVGAITRQRRFHLGAGVGHQTARFSAQPHHVQRLPGLVQRKHPLFRSGGKSDETARLAQRLQHLGVGGKAGQTAAVVKAGDVLHTIQRDFTCTRHAEQRIRPDAPPGLVQRQVKRLAPFLAHGGTARFVRSVLAGIDEPIPNPRREIGTIALHGQALAHRFGGRCRDVCGSGLQRTCRGGRDDCDTKQKQGAQQTGKRFEVCHDNLPIGTI